MPGHSHALHRAAASSPCHKNLLREGIQFEFLLGFSCGCLLGGVYSKLQVQQ